MRRSKAVWHIGFVFLLPTTLALGNDWPSWRGPEQTGMTREKAPVQTWSESGENLLWKSDIGGRTTPIIMNGRLYTIAPTGEEDCLQEQVVCLDAENGKTIWRHKFNVYHTDIVENRVGWTAPVGDPETGNVYVHGTGGDLIAFDRDGKILWERSLAEEFGRYSGYGGRLHTPIVDEDKVIISIVYILSQWGTGPAKAGHRYYAFDKRTGEVLWASQPGGRPHDTTYATPVVAVINGKRMLIAPNADGNVYGMLARTGEKIWTFQLSKRGLNTSPVVEGNYVYVSHSEENLDGTEMGRLVCIDASKTGDITQSGEVWRYEGLGVGYASPAVANGRVYAAVNSAKLFSLDAKTGKEKWVHNLGTVMRGSPTVTSDGVIYVGELNGRFHTLRDKGDSCESLVMTQFTHPEDLVVEIFGSPAVANGRVYFMTRYGTYALGPKEKPADVKVPIPSSPAEKKLASDEVFSGSPRLHVVPAEIVLNPGGEQKFKLLAFDDHGRRIADFRFDGAGADGPWSVEGVKGTISGDGTFRAAGANEYSAGVVRAKLGGAEGVARVRVAPSLPIDESFDKMALGKEPPGWTGLDTSGKIVEKDGQIVFQKFAESPSAPYARMRAMAGLPIPIGYTVQADLLGLPKEESRSEVLSDMGLINCRYKMILLGHEKQLRLVAWAPMPRLQKDVAFDWKPGVWYRAKMRVERDGDKAVILGKVWPRDEEEPKEWTARMTDPCPSLEGNPGLYAYTKGTTPKRHGAPSFFDNFQVIRND